MSKKPTVLMILDGYGLNENKEANAVAEAKTPVMDKLMKEYPFVKGNASGMAVGLPEGQMGNSEVGHMNLGAGRVVYQNLVKLNMAVENGSLGKEKGIVAAFNYAKENHKKIHLIGQSSITTHYFHKFIFYVG